MVLMINGVPLEEAPRDVPAFLTQYPHFKESASRLVTHSTQAQTEIIYPKNVGAKVAIDFT